MQAAKGRITYSNFRDLSGAVSLKTIKSWKVMHAKGEDVLGRQYTRLLMASTQKNVKKVESLIRKKLSTKNIGTKLGISNSTVRDI